MGFLNFKGRKDQIRANQIQNVHFLNSDPQHRHFVNGLDLGKARTFSRI